jgi:2-amino-4-hydroxy-6-hydroxymethyldihydropteridine diphosphokinase
MVECFLGIGSNLGDRRKQIKAALEKINALEETKIIKLSGIIESKPQGGPAGQGKFLNAAIKIRTKLSPQVLLKQLKIIEKESGRRKTLRNGARTIDLDILFYGDRTVETKNLKIPHPRIFEREFVLKPLMEII